MNNLNAEFISPLVSKLHQTDPTVREHNFGFDFESNSQLVSEFELPQIEKILSNDIISLIQDISEGREIFINEEDSIKIKIIAILIGNEELAQEMNNLYPISNDQHTIDHYLIELQYYYYLSNNINQQDVSNSNYIDAISSEFFSIPKEKLLKLPKPILLKIIQSDQLSIESEDDLFDFIVELFNQDNPNDDQTEIIKFFESIFIKNLSERKFLEFIKMVELNQMTMQIWKGLINRLSTVDQIEDEKNKRYNDHQYKQTFEYDGNSYNAFKGIIQNLTEKAGGNVDDKGFVTITSSSVSGNDRLAKYVVDLGNKETYFRSSNKENSWLKFDFLNKKVNPTHYSIRTKPSGQSSEHLKSWVIEGSNDGEEKWTKLDEKVEITLLDEKSAFRTFEIQKDLSKSEFYRFIRIRQNGKNAYDDFYLNIAGLELFGTIIGPK